MNMNLFKFKVFFEGAARDVDGINYTNNSVLFLDDNSNVVCLGFKLANLMQCTGYTARDANEIYTGMIVENEGGEHFAVIQAANGELMLGNMADVNDNVGIEGIDLSECEIIGTIWDK